MIEAFAQQIMADVDKVKLTPPPSLRWLAIAVSCYSEQVSHQINVMNNNWL
jgi:hypothetical protein